MNGYTVNKGNTKIYEESISRLVSVDVIKNSILSEDLLKNYQEIVNHTPGLSHFARNVASALMHAQVVLS